LHSSWKILWSSEDPRYGGDATPALDSDLNWTIPAHSAVVLEPESIPPEAKLE
jgi:maltooligosyltrehalose trehalohydrolase